MARQMTNAENAMMRNAVQRSNKQPTPEELQEWCDLCPDISEQDAEAIDIENPPEEIGQFRAYCNWINKLTFSSWMITRLKEQCGHSLKRAKVRVMMRFGWFPGWTHDTAKAKLVDRVKANDIPTIGLASKDTRSWKNTVTANNPGMLPSPLPYIPKDSMSLESIANRESMKKKKQQQLRKVKSTLTEREAWEWAKDHVEVEGLTLDDCPGGKAFTFYKMARRDPNGFIKEDFKRYGKEDNDKQTSAKKRWLEDDMRTKLGLVIRLREEMARISVAAPSPRHEQ